MNRQEAYGAHYAVGFEEEINPSYNAITSGGTCRCPCIPILFIAEKDYLCCLNSEDTFAR